MKKLLIRLGLIWIIALFAQKIHNDYKTGINQLMILDGMRQELKGMKENSDAIRKQLENYSQSSEIDTSSVVLVGKASWYDYELSGSGWSSLGHRVCASRDFPRNSTLLVTNVSNGKQVRCLVTDYGPNAAAHPDRVIDLSSHAFSQLAPTVRGIVNVKVERVD